MHHSDRVVSCRFHDANSEVMSSVGRDCIHDNRSEFKLLRWFLDARFHRQAIIHNEQTYIKHINSPRHTLAYTLPCPPQSCKEGLQTMATPRALKVWTSLALDVTSLSWWLFAAPKGRPSKPTPTKASRDRDNAQDGLSVLYRTYQRVWQISTCKCGCVMPAFPRAALLKTFTQRKLSDIGLQQACDTKKGSCDSGWWENMGVS